MNLPELNGTADERGVLCDYLAVENAVAIVDLTGIIETRLWDTASFGVNDLEARNIVTDLRSSAWALRKAANETYAAVESGDEDLVDLAMDHVAELVAGFQLARRELEATADDLDDPAHPVAIVLREVVEIIERVIGSADELLES